MTRFRSNARALVAGLANRLRATDRSERAYWLGLGMLFAGLAAWISWMVALVVVGAVIAGESVVTSYVAGWLGTRSS